MVYMVFSFFWFPSFLISMYMWNFSLCYVCYFHWSMQDYFLCFHEGFLLLMRVIAATFCVTLAASLAARHGSTSMAAFQVCLQVAMSTSLLADGLAVAGQVRIVYYEEIQFTLLISSMSSSHICNMETHLFFQMIERIKYWTDYCRNKTWKHIVGYQLC